MCSTMHQINVLDITRLRSVYLISYRRLYLYRVRAHAMTNRLSVFLQHSEASHILSSLLNPFFYNASTVNRILIYRTISTYEHEASDRARCWYLNVEAYGHFRS